MPQPPAYAPAFDFQADEAARPNGHVPGVALDAEFANLALTLVQVLANLSKIQRDDGALRNASVSIEQLSPALLLLINASSEWRIRGPFVGNSTYAVGDIITVNNGLTAMCHTAYKAGQNWGGANWIVLYDSNGVIPADGSVSSAKISNGAVLAQHLGMNTLDLAGSIRGQGGIAAGTAPPGSLFHAKAAAGEAFAIIERTTDAQGPVGLRIKGVGALWQLAQAPDSNNLNLGFAAPDFRTLAVFRPNQSTEWGGSFLVTAVDDAGGSEGIRLEYVGGAGLLTAFDYNAAEWRDLRLRGATVFLSPSGVDVMQATSASVNFLVPVTQNGRALGYLGIPQIADADAHVLTAAANGQCIYSENTAPQVVTVPLNVFGDDATITVVNDGTSNITLSGEAGVTLRLAATPTTGNRTLAPGGWAVIKCVKANRFFVSGPGVS